MTRMTKMHNKKMIIMLFISYAIFGFTILLVSTAFLAKPNTKQACKQQYATADECINALRQPEPSLRNSNITYDGKFRKFTIGVKFIQDYEIVCRGIDLISETPVSNASNRGFVENLCLNE
jgi:flagellar basal body-associated protein FliL